MHRKICLALAVAWVATTASADDWNANWPCFRGPARTGVAPSGLPPLTWSEDSNIKWKVSLPGHGSGSPIVWGNRIYLQTAIETDRTEPQSSDAAAQGARSPFHLTAGEGDQPVAQPDVGSQSRFQQVEDPEAATRREGSDAPREGRGFPRRGFGGRGFGRSPVPKNVYQFVVLCLDRQTGKTIWQQTACEAVPHEGHHGTASFASYTPVTDGKNLYVSFGSRGIYSYTLDGQLRWKRDLGQMHIRHSFGEGASPALYEDTLVINWDHEGQSFITALDANTGNTRWKVDRDEETTWLTPLIVEHGGKLQIVVNGMNRARGYDLHTGEVIWECGGQAMGAVPTAVAYQGLAICMTGHRGAALYAIPLSARGDITGSDQIVWSLDRDTPYVPSPLLYDDKLYFTKSNNAMLSCYLAATGEQLYKTKRLPDLNMIYASPVAANGRIYFCGRNGVTTVVKHGPEFEILATNTLDETIDATPAIVGQDIILRTAGHLYCIAE